MHKEYRVRYTITGIVFTIIMVVLVVQLFNLQFVQGEKHLTDAQEFSRKEIRLTGPRGKILDRDGLPLAYNKTSYSVQFVRDPALTEPEDRAKYTQGMILAMKIIEENGGKYISTFAIRKMADGTYDFYWPGIDKQTNPKAYNDRITTWKNLNCGNSRKIYKDSTPEEIFNQCREYYFIPADSSYDEAFKVLSVWQEIRATYFASYIPVTLAQNVDMQTVAIIEKNLIDMPGIQINQSSTRVYPNKTMAAHIIGYMGRMLDERTMVDMEKLGYKRDDLIGVSGIESTLELELTGNIAERTGTSVVEVNNLGGISREIYGDNKSPKPGNNVMLTIDSGMQKRLEEALAENIAQIRSAQETEYRAKQEYYNEELKDRKSKSIKYADSGAAIVMSVQTGEILAMASYPSFDLNIFSNGSLSEEEFKKITQDDRNPLFNNAISSRGTPGSVFKMVTGLAGLMENVLLLDQQIDDGGYFNTYVADTNVEQGPTCWAFPNNIYKHKKLDIVAAIKYSCNYFFYTVAGNLRSDRLNKWADLLGLSSTTNVELPNEVAGQIGSQAALYSSGHMSGVAALVRNKIVALMRKECEKLNLVYTDEQYTEVAIKMMDLVNNGVDEKGPDIRALLKNELKITTDLFKISNDINAYLYEIKWNANYTIEAGIGQSVTLLTPIAMARYISALVNGGDVYEARLVKSIISPDGIVVDKPPKLIRNLGAPPEFLQAIKQGMQDVVSEEEGGTAADYFEDFTYDRKLIGGKTGTAEVSKTIDLENNSWFVAFTPFDKPEIAVVVYIPSGYQGALSSYTAKEILEYYLDMKYKEKVQQGIPQVNTLVE